MNRLACAIGCVLALASCATSPPGSAPAAHSVASARSTALTREDRESRHVLELIAYAQRVASLQGEEQQRELNASSQIFSKERTAYARVRLALLLALPGTAFSDEAKAAGLLEPVAAVDAGSAGPMQQFAGLMHAQISERLREQRRATQLKEQLDAMKEIERKIIEREQVRPR
jgi:hypothetical protein